MASKLQYKVSLTSVFDRAYSDKGKEFRSKIRPILSNSEVKRNIGERIIEEIVNRTQNKNIDKNGEPLERYSKSYKKSLRFKIYNKDSSVNMTLTGEMLASMVPVVKSSGYDLIIEFADKANNNKAHGHVKGTKYLPVRDFFGLPQDIETKILKETINQSLTQAALNNLDVNVGLTVGRQNLILGGT